jgi:hypothetical protein
MSDTEDQFQQGLRDVERCRITELEAERDNLLEGIATVTPYLRNKDENGYTVVNTFKLEALAALENADE